MSSTRTALDGEGVLLHVDATTEGGVSDSSADLIDTEHVDAPSQADSTLGVGGAGLRWRGADAGAGESNSHSGIGRSLDDVEEDFAVGARLGMPER